MADSSELFLLCAGTALVNVTYAAKNNHSVPGSLIASGVSLAGLTFLAGVWRTDVPTAIAGLFFFAALILRGVPLIEDFSRLPQTAKFTAGGGGNF